jgi:uncharacterized protein with PIN domain
MARKSKYDQLVDALRERLREMAPENCTSVEQAVQNDQILSTVFGTVPSQATDYSRCPTCQRVCWHEVCQVCS